MKKNTILIVDDQEVNRFLLSEIFADKYEIIEAANGIEAIKAIKKDAMRICVVLLDIVMPEMGGFEVLDLLRKKKLLGIMPVIMITGDTNPELENKGFDKVQQTLYTSRLIHML